MSERCVSCVSSAVALRKRIPELRPVALRSSELSSVASVYPSASPRSTLAGVFERMKRAAQSKKSLRIAERFAPKSGALRKSEMLRVPVQFGGSPFVERSPVQRIPVEGIRDLRVPSVPRRESSEWRICRVK